MTEKRRPGRPATGQDPNQNFRMRQDRWDRLKDTAEQAGTNRSQVLNDFASWYTHEPNAKAVRRPEPVAEPAADKETAGEP